MSPHALRALRPVPEARHVLAAIAFVEELPPAVALEECEEGRTILSGILNGYYETPRGKAALLGVARGFYDSSVFAVLCAPGEMFAVPATRFVTERKEAVGYRYILEGPLAGEEECLRHFGGGLKGSINLDMSSFLTYRAVHDDVCVHDGEEPHRRALLLPKSPGALAGYRLCDLYRNEGNGFLDRVARMDVGGPVPYTGRHFNPI